MIPFLPIITALFPELVKTFAGDQAGKVADDVAKAVKDITGTADPEAAKQAVAASPALSDALRQRLAEIQVEATKAQNEAAAKKQQLENDNAEKKRQYELEQLRQAYGEMDSRRANDLERMKTSIQDISNARDRLGAFAQANSPMQWGAPAVSFAVIGVFFAILMFLINADPYNKWSSDVSQIVNITIGALVAAFTAVVNFWLGSSQGSRDKDDTIAKQSSATISAQVEQTSKVIEAVRGTGGGGPQDAGPSGAKSSADKKDNFDRCLGVTLLQEGGYTDDARDSGGATNLGITIGELKDWRHAQDPSISRESITAEEVKKLTKAEAIEIYRTNYWNKARCGDLPSGVDLEVFDMGVNAGPSRSIKILQEILGVTVDGWIGPETLEAAKGRDPATVIRGMSEGRLKFYRSLHNFDAFGRGWTNRVHAVEQKALAMVGH
jgi:lysozyme family protein